MTHDEIKKLLMARVDEIVDAIKNDKILEIRKDRNSGVQVFEVKRKSLN